MPSFASLLSTLAEVLPRIRRKIAEHLGAPDLARRRTLALAIRLLDLTGMRVGNREYGQQNGSYGLTTLESCHARFHQGRVEFSFPGKSGNHHTIEVTVKWILPALKATYETDSDPFFT